jgi:hypothetical protein
MPPAWAQRQAELLRDCLVSPDVFHHMVDRLREFAMPYQHALETGASQRHVPPPPLLGVDFLLTTCRSNITSLSIRSEDFGDGFCSNRSETGSAHCYHEGNATTHVCRRKPCLATGDY